jgi:hypothetical protein
VGGLMKVRFSVASREIQGANRFAIEMIDQFTEKSYHHPDSAGLIKPLNLSE